jgi:DNA invertase Pin-like site-specific DNA recombinase
MPHVLAALPLSSEPAHRTATYPLALAAGCDPDHLFIDKGLAGKLASLPRWDDCLGYLRSGDVVVVTRRSRAARSLRNLLDVVDQLHERGIDLVVLRQAIDTTTPAGRLAFHVMAAIDEFQRELIVEGTSDGLAAARARGRTGGGKPKLSPAQVRLARELYDGGRRGREARSPSRRSAPCSASPVPRSTGTLIVRESQRGDALGLQAGGNPPPKVGTRAV